MTSSWNKRGPRSHGLADHPYRRTARHSGVTDQYGAGVRIGQSTRKQRLRGGGPSGALLPAPVRPHKSNSPAPCLILLAAEADVKVISTTRKEQDRLLRTGQLLLRRPTNTRPPRRTYFVMYHQGGCELCLRAALRKDDDGFRAAGYVAGRYAAGGPRRRSAGAPMPPVRSARPRRSARRPAHRHRTVRRAKSYLIALSCRTGRARTSAPPGRRRSCDAVPQPPAGIPGPDRGAVRPAANRWSKDASAGSRRHG